jgi:sugar lactone lactonase YvrE
VFGTEGHNGKHGGAIFPDTLRWLWRDWQTNIEVKANAKGESKWIGEQVVGHEEWQKAPGNDGALWLGKNSSGEVIPSGERNTLTLRHDGLHVDKVEGEVMNNLMVGAAAWSPDQTLLYVATVGKRIFSLNVDSKGHATNAQAFVEIVCGEYRTHASGLCVDTNGWLYVATSLGIQVCDQAGRVNFIIPTPEEPSDVCFGGKDLSELFIACGDAIYKRSTKAQGIVSGQMAPIKPPPPKL